MLIISIIRGFIIQNRDGADAETVVCALFHDVGEVLNHVNHGEIGQCHNGYDDKKLGGPSVPQQIIHT